MRAWFWGLRDERGSHLPELAMAMLVLSVVVMGVAAAMASSLAYVGGARQRSAGSAVASEHLELLERKFKIDNPALDADAVQEARQEFASSIALDVSAEELFSLQADNEEPNHPIENVTDGSECGGAEACYTVEEGGDPEPLLFGGSIEHERNPVTLGTTQFFVNQYVTCPVQETSCDPDSNGEYEPHYRRVTVVVTWVFPVNAGPSNRVTQSTLISIGTINVPESEGAAGPGGNTGPALEAPDLIGCEAEISTGSIEVLSGAGAEAGFHGSPDTQVRLEVASECPLMIAELQTTLEGVEPTEEDWVYVACWRDPPDVELPDCAERVAVPDGEPGAFESVTVAWMLPATDENGELQDGTYIIHARFRDRPDVTIFDATEVILDTGPPTTPAGFAANCSIQGADRTVEFTWLESSDSPDGGPGNLLGYRLYRSINNLPFQVVSTTASTSTSDVHRKTESSVRFFVRAYDKAGNESGNSDVISFSKNSC